MTGLLSARAGCTVTVLEKHPDFFPRGHGAPSTMEILDQLGLLRAFLHRPHSRFDRAELRIAGRDWLIGDLSHLSTPAPFVAMMPQWGFWTFCAPMPDAIRVSGWSRARNGRCRNGSSAACSNPPHR